MEWRRFTFSLDADEPVTCHRCGHTGKPSLEFVGETIIETECGSCGGRLGFYEVPTAEAIRAAAADGVPGAIAQLGQVDDHERFLARVDEHALQSAADLPPVPGDEAFVVAWDRVEERGDHWFVLSVGELEIARELATYESGRRYMEVADLLATAYGARLRAIEPTDAAEVWILGDKLGWAHLIESVNERLPGAGG